MGNVLEGNLEVVGKAYDDVDDRLTDFLYNEMWPDTTTKLLENFEEAYGLSSDGSDAIRRSRIIAAIRNTGGLTKVYIEELANKVAPPPALVDITEGTLDLGFIVGNVVQPLGSATPLPATLGEPDQIGAKWTITVTVTNAPYAPIKEIELLVNKLKPAWVKAFYSYVF